MVRTRYSSGRSAYDTQPATPGRASRPPSTCCSCGRGGIAAAGRKSASLRGGYSMFTSRAATAHRRDRYTVPWLSSVRCLGPVSIVSPFFILSGDSQPARCSNIAATSQVATAPAITSCSFNGATTTSNPVRRDVCFRAEAKLDFTAYKFGPGDIEIVRLWGSPAVGATPWMRISGDGEHVFHRIMSTDFTGS